LGLALGRLGPIEGALQPLNRALDESPEDAQLAASLLSAQLLAGRLPQPPPAPAAGPLSEMAGAVYWLLGQSALRQCRPDVAARDFQLAGVLLGTGAPAVLRAQRASAAYFGEAVSRLAAGQLEAAQQCYLRLPDRNRLPAETAAFARQLYEVADALREIDPSDQAAALQPLVDLIGAARLRLRFFDQERPVEIWWDHLP
jgi:tetratricopeptide (TPR) repeat protein